MIFIIDILQIHCKSEHKQVKGNKINDNMCKSDKCFLIYKVVDYLNDFCNLFFVYLKNEI